MKRLMLLACLSLSLAGCGPMLALAGGIPPAPAAVADRTVIDEQAALSVELAYQAAALAIATAADFGALNGERATRAAAIDRAAYRAVLATRAAYDAGNTTSYGAAAQSARTQIAALLALLED